MVSSIVNMLSEVTMEYPSEDVQGTVRNLVSESQRDLVEAMRLDTITEKE